MCKRHACIGLVLTLIIALFVFPLPSKAVSPSNLEGWVIAPVGSAPYTFAAGPGTPPLGAGSLHIAITGPGQKFYMFRTFSGLEGCALQSVTYGLYNAPASTVATSEYYANILIDQVANGIGTFSNGYFDCAYDYVPGPLAAGVWHTVGPDSGFTGWAKITGNPSCPTSLGGLAAGDLLLAIAMNAGQQFHDTDIGLDGAFDNVVITTSCGPIVFDFEPDATPDDPAATTDATMPGCDMLPLPEDAVVGKFVETTPLYFAPAEDAATEYVMAAGKSLWVYGLDASEQYYQVQLSCGLYWVPRESIGPNYDDVWNGTPLPTTIVE